eukprot:2581338-Pleurochrysis_carterae.AAC.1
MACSDSTSTVRVFTWKTSSASCTVIEDAQHACSDASRSMKRSPLAPTSKAPPDGVSRRCATTT